MSSKLEFNKPVAQTVLFSALSAALGSGAALAQDQGEVQQLPTLTAEASAPDNYQVTRVQSPKMTAPLLDTPRTVNVVTEELMKDRGATSLKDVLRTTPGISLGSGEGGTPQGDRPHIRGYEASTDIFIDGVRDYARGSHEVFNLESVEVIKGPSSAYTGRGGTGGSINMVTKTPKLENFFEGSVGWGNRGQHRLTVDGNIAFGESMAFRLNAMRQGGGVPGRYGNEYDRWGIAPSLAFGLGTPTRVTLSYSHIENNDTPDWGIPFSNQAVPSLSQPLKADRNNFYGRLGADYRKNKFDTATAIVEHDITDKITFRNVTRWGTSVNHYIFTRPSFDNCTVSRNNPVIAPSCSSLDGNLQFTRADRARWRSAESLVNQTDLFGEFYTGSIKHNFALGFEISKEDIYNRDTTGVGVSGAPKTDNFWHPNPHQNWLVNKNFGEKTKAGEIKNRSIYFFDTIELTPQWLVNGGVRFDHFTANDLTAKEGSGLQKASYNIWSWQAGLVYKPVHYGSIYFNFATSANPPGENLGQGGGLTAVDGGQRVYEHLSPERSRSLELGTKWDLLDERLSLTAAVFETRKSNARSFDPDTQLTQNIGKSRVRGLELGVSGSITDKWDIWAGYAYLDPKVLKFTRNGTDHFDGNYIPAIARHTASLWTTYKVHPQLTVGAGFSYVGKRFVDSANKYELPSHVVWDAMVRYDVNKNIDLQLNLKNIGNARNYDASHTGLFANISEGRSVMLNANFRY